MHSTEHCKTFFLTGWIFLLCDQEVEIRYRDSRSEESATNFCLKKNLKSTKVMKQDSVSLSEPYLLFAALGDTGSNRTQALL